MLFLTRLWDPDAPEVENEEIAEQRRSVNEQRIKVARMLQEELGDMVCVGIQNGGYAKAAAPDLIASASLTLKPLYIHAMKQSSICVSTLGLHDSNGWKFGEYLAAGRAIVSEKPVYEVPYASAGENWIEFCDADGCVSAVVELVENPAQAEALRQRNQEYYERHLRPDRLIYDTLVEAGVAIDEKPGCLSLE